MQVAFLSRFPPYFEDKGDAPVISKPRKTACSGLGYALDRSEPGFDP